MTLFSFFGRCAKPPTLSPICMSDAKGNRAERNTATTCVPTGVRDSHIFPSFRSKFVQFLGVTFRVVGREQFDFVLLCGHLSAGCADTFGIELIDVTATAKAIPAKTARIVFRFVMIRPPVRRIVSHSICRRRVLSRRFQNQINAGPVLLCVQQQLGHVPVLGSGSDS